MKCAQENDCGLATSCSGRAEAALRGLSEKHGVPKRELEQDKRAPGEAEEATVALR